MRTGYTYVVFGIGDELFAAGTDNVREVIRPPQLTQVPDSLPFLEGVIHIRGSILPLLNLRKRFKLPARTATAADRVIIAERDGRTLGLLVDSVSDVLRVRETAIECPPGVVSAIGIQYICGMLRLGERIILVVDMEKVLNIDSMLNPTESSSQGRQSAA